MEIQKGLKVEVNFISESRTEFSGTVFKGIGIVDLIEDDRVFGKLLNSTPFMCSISDVSPYVENLSPDEVSFQEWYLNAGGKQIELEKEDGAYTHSKSQMAWDIWQAVAVSPAISNKIVIGTQVKIIDPDDTSEYGVEAGDKGVVVWVGDFGTIFGVCIPAKLDVWSFEPCQFEVISNEVPNQASTVPECEWSHDSNEDMYGTWHTKCGSSFVLNEDGPAENRMNHCCYCGGKLIEAQEPSNV